MTKSITSDDFSRRYRPVKNPFVRNGPWAGCLLEPFGSERLHVLEVLAEAPAKVWTLVDEAGRLALTSGYHQRNCIGYLLTEVAVEPDVVVLVDDGDQSRTEELPHAA